MSMSESSIDRVNRQLALDAAVRLYASSGIAVTGGPLNSTRLRDELNARVLATAEEFTEWLLTGKRR